jgi:hypothetical protein
MIVAFHDALAASITGKKCAGWDREAPAEVLRAWRLPQ